MSGHSLSGTFLSLQNDIIVKKKRSKIEDENFQHFEIS